MSITIPVWLLYLFAGLFGVLAVAASALLLALVWLGWQLCRRTPGW